MFICPTCKREFAKEEMIAKHFLSCWKEHNPNHRSKDAPSSETIIVREVNSDIENFLSNFRKD